MSCNNIHISPHSLRLITEFSVLFSSQSCFITTSVQVLVLQSPHPPVLHAGVGTVPLPLLLALRQQSDDPPQLSVEPGQAAPDEDQHQQPAIILSETGGLYGAK